MRPGLTVVVALALLFVLISSPAPVEAAVPQAEIDAMVAICNGFTVNNQWNCTDTASICTGGWLGVSCIADHIDKIEYALNSVSPVFLLFFLFHALL